MNDFFFFRFRAASARAARKAVSTRTYASANTITITRPDDFHLHVRDGAGLKSVVPFTARQFGRAIIMPNLKPPVLNAKQVSHLNLPWGGGSLLRSERLLLPGARVQAPDPGGRPRAPDL